MLIMNNKKIDHADTWTPITLSKYNALPNSKKMNNTAYLILLENDENQERLDKLFKMIGDVDKLYNYADGTLIGIIRDLYSRLGGFSFRQDNYRNFSAIYDDTIIPVDVPAYPGEESSESAKILYLYNLIGDMKPIFDLGYPTLVDAILDIYKRLNNLGFEFINNNIGIYDTI